MLGTGGTKLTDRGVGALLDGCEALEEFEMVEVQGTFGAISVLGSSLMSEAGIN